MSLTMPTAPGRKRIAAVLVCGALATAACGGGTLRTPPVVTAGATDDDTMAGLKEYHRYHHHGGVTLFVAMSLDALGVAPERREAVEQIRLELNRAMDPARLAEQHLVETLADGLVAGSLVQAKVDASMLQVQVASSAVHGASVLALNELHGVLTPAERAALVDKVTSHWAVWQRTNAERGADGQNDGHLAALSEYLELSPDQVEKIRAGLGEGQKRLVHGAPPEISPELRQFGDAFRGDTFDANALTVIGDASAQVGTWGAAHLANFVETAVLVLTPEQRVRLAEHLREHASHGSVAQGHL